MSGSGEGGKGGEPRFDRGPVRTRSTDEVNQFLDPHIVESTNMQCLTPPRPSPIARNTLGLRNEPVTPVGSGEGGKGGEPRF